MKHTTLKICLAATISIFVLDGCTEPVPPQPETAAPTIEWASNPEFETIEIEEQMNVDIRITAEAGIKEFVVSVDSHALSPSISLFTSDSTSNMDLINDAKLIGMLTAFGIDLPAGDRLKDKTEVLFSLSTLVPMIADVSGQKDHDTNHVFTLNMTDNENRTLSKSLTFHYSYAE